MGLGYDIADIGDRLTYGRLATIVRRSPSDSALMRSLSDDWSRTDHLLALIGDTLALANWQRQGKGERPKPITRPGVEDKTRKRLGTGRMTLSEARKWTERRKRGD